MNTNIEVEVSELTFLMRFFKGLGCEVEYLEDKATKDDNEELVQDVLSLFTCFSARLKRFSKKDGKTCQEKDVTLL